MPLPARSAPIRGDDYQHAVGWLWACRMLEDRQIASVSVEDRDGGAFDDVVVRRITGRNTYIQAKSSNYADRTIDREMLLTAARPGGKSPLQHFYDTYKALAAQGGEFSLEFWTHKAFDANNPLLSDPRDLRHDRIAVDQMLEAGPQSAIGKERDAWTEHLGATADELADFLRCVRWKHTGSELDIRGEAKTQMRLAGLRGDDGAVITGIGIVREWVSNGAGPQTAEDVGRQAAEFGLVPALPHLAAPAAEASDGALASLPPACRARIESLAEISAESAGRVAAELNQTASRTPGVLAQLAVDPPEWLQEADCLAWEAFADFLSAHKLPGTWEMRCRAIDMGSPRSDQYWIGEAQTAHYDDDDARAEELLALASPEHPLAEAAQALVAGESRAVVDAIRSSEALMSDDPEVATMGFLMLASAHSQNEEPGRAISVMQDAVERFPDRASLHLMLAQQQLALAIGLADEARHDLPSAAAANAIRARNEFRRWQGPSADAVAAAAAAYHLLNQPEQVVEIAAAAPEGEATTEEAHDGEVGRYLAHALLRLRRGNEIDDAVLDRVDGSESTLLRATQAHARNDPDAVDLMRQAVSEAEDRRALVLALEGLSLFGETDEQALASIAGDGQGDADRIRASAAYHAGDYDRAIAILGRYRSQSAAHVEILAAAMHSQGRSEEAVTVLLESAEALGAPMLHTLAVDLLIDLDQLERAEAEAQRALAANPSRAARLRLLTALVAAAERLGDWPMLERYGQEFASAFPDHPEARWHVVHSLHLQARFQDAWGYLAEHDLSPVNEQTALLAISVYVRWGAPADGAGRMLRIASEFPDSEEVVGSAIGALMAASGQEGQLSEAQATGLGELVVGFVRRYPESRVLREHTFSDIEELAEMVRSWTEPPARQRASWVAQVRFGELPYGVLQWLQRLPYAEYLLRTGAAYLTAISPDVAERNRERSAAEAAIGGEVAADTSVAVVGRLADIDVAAMGSAFNGVLVARELLDDVRAAVASAETAPDARGGYDPVLGDYDFSEIQDEDRQRLIGDAEALLATLENWLRTPSHRIRPAGYSHGDSLRPWDASVRLAMDRGCALWCDDIALRRRAAAAGVPAFGTYALYEALSATGDTGDLPGPAEMKMRLLRARIADVPISLGELTEAADDSEGPDPAVALFLGRPASWADNTEEVLKWYLGRAAALMAGPHREQLAGLLIAACCGLGAAAIPEHRPSAIGRVLADTLWQVNNSAMTPVLLEASRLAGREIDLAADLDPIEHTTRRLVEILRSLRIDPATTAWFVKGVFSQAQLADQLAASSICAQLLLGTAS